MKRRRNIDEIRGRTVLRSGRVLVASSESAATGASTGGFFSHDLRTVLGENHPERSRSVSVLAERLFRTQEQLRRTGSHWLYRKDQGPVAILLQTAQRQHPRSRREGVCQLGEQTPRKVPVAGIVQRAAQRKRPR